MIKKYNSAVRWRRKKRLKSVAFFNYARYARAVFSLGIFNVRFTWLLTYDNTNSDVERSDLQCVRVCACESVF